MSNFLDFNTADRQSEFDVEMIQCEAINRLPELLKHLFPNGTFNHNHFMIGNVAGESGNSLKVTLTGKEAGMWHDFATSEGGNIITLWAMANGLSTEKGGFIEVIQSLSNYLNNSPQPTNSAQSSKAPSLDNLGHYSAKWDYHDSDGNLILCQYRYDTDKGKVFRPWDVKAQKHKAPFPRPLYNQPGIKNDDHIVIVEGEKCADALIEQGITATTAMNGANAPVDKTDWSPLQGKHILLWPDNDQAGRDYSEAVNHYLTEKAIPKSITLLKVPVDKPDKWDAADAVNEQLTIRDFIKACVAQTLEDVETVPSHFIGNFFDDVSPMPDDIISPRLLTPAGLLVFGGAPKVGKSNFLLSMLTAMASGQSFLGLKPPRALKIFYLQAEVGYHYLRERLKNMVISKEQLDIARKNLVITPQVKLLLDKQGVKKIINTIKQDFPDDLVDVIAIDPLRNVFDGGDNNSSENDNSAMLFFLQQRLELLRDKVNPQAAIILSHHTRKIPKKQLEEDPFQAFCGASSLRGFYTTGVIMYQPDENHSYRKLIFELRNGSGINDKTIDKVDGVWQEIDLDSVRLTNREYGEKLDAERRRKHDVILQIIYDQARLGDVYTMNQFCQVFEGYGGLGSKESIQGRLDVLATNGYIKFFKNAESYGLRKLARTKFGYLCVEAMSIRVSDENIDPATGEPLARLKPVYPTHYKCKKEGIVLPVENPQVWVYYDEVNQS